MLYSKLWYHFKEYENRQLTHAGVTIARLSQLITSIGEIDDHLVKAVVKVYQDVTFIIRNLVMECQLVMVWLLSC